MIVAWQTDSFEYGGAGHFVCVSPTVAGPAVLPAGWLPTVIPRLADGDDVTLRQYLALEADNSVIIPNHFPPAKIGANLHRPVGDYSPLAGPGGGRELVTTAIKGISEWVPAGAATKIDASLIIYCCRKAEDEATQMEAREIGGVGSNTVEPDSMLATVLQLYAYMCELPRLETEYCLAIGQTPPEPRDVWVSDRLQKCVNDLRAICNRCPALVQRLDHQVDLWTMCELDAKGALYASYASKLSSLEKQTLALKLGFGWQKRKVVERLDALQTAGSNSGCVLLFPLVKAREMKRYWDDLLERQKDLDQRLVKKIKLGIATSEEDQRLLADQSPTPRSPLRSSKARRFMGEDYATADDDDDDDKLERVHSMPAPRESSSLLAAKMGTTEAEVSSASRDTMIEHIMTLTGLFGPTLPKAVAVPTSLMAPPPPSGRSDKQLTNASGDDGSVATLRRGVSVGGAPSPSGPGARLVHTLNGLQEKIGSTTAHQSPQIDLVRVRELWQSHFVTDRGSNKETQLPGTSCQLSAEELGLEEGFQLQVRTGEHTFFHVAVQERMTVHEVKKVIACQHAGPKVPEQALFIQMRSTTKMEGLTIRFERQPKALNNDQTLAECGVNSRTTLVLMANDGGSCDGKPSAGRGISRRRETMMRRNKVMDAVRRGWESVGVSVLVMSARLDPDRTAEREFVTFVQRQLELIQHERVKLQLPTTDQLLERLLTEHTEDEDTMLTPKEAIANSAMLDEGEEAFVEVIFRVANVKGVEPFSHRFPASSTTAHVHAYLVTTMAASGMGGGYNMKESGFPPRLVVPSDQQTLADTSPGLLVDGRLTLQVVQTSVHSASGGAATDSSASATGSHSPAAGDQMGVSPPASDQIGVSSVYDGSTSRKRQVSESDELCAGGSLYEAVKSKYIGGRSSARLTAGKVYRAPLVRDRAFTYDPKDDRLVEVEREQKRPAVTSAEDAGLEDLYRSMFTDEEVLTTLQPGGRYYAQAARSLGVSIRGPLNPRLLYSIPNSLMQCALQSNGGRPDAGCMFNFTYDDVNDRLVYSHCGPSAAEAGGDEDAGTMLGRTPSVELQREAQCLWQRRDFLRRECLRPGGLLYMNAVDSFGAQLRTDRVYYFPHFGPIKDDQFRYNAEYDCLVAEQDVQSDFIGQGTINPGGSSIGGSKTHVGGAGQLGSGVLPGHVPSTEETDGERAARVRAARLARLGQ